MAGFLYFIECGQGALGPDDAPELRALSDSLASIRIEGLTLGDIDALGTKPGRDLDERVSGLLVASGTFALYQMRMAPSQQAWLDKGTVWLVVSNARAGAASIRIRLRVRVSCSGLTCCRVPRSNWATATRGVFRRCLGAWMDALRAS